MNKPLRIMAGTLHIFSAIEIFVRQIKYAWHVKESKPPSITIDGLLNVIKC